MCVKRAVASGHWRGERAWRRGCQAVRASDADGGCPPSLKLERPGFPGGPDVTLGRAQSRTGSPHGRWPPTEKAAARGARGRPGELIVWHFRFGTSQTPIGAVDLKAVGFGKLEVKGEVEAEVRAPEGSACSGRDRHGETARRPRGTRGLVSAARSLLKSADEEPPMQRPGRPPTGGQTRRRVPPSARSEQSISRREERPPLSKRGGRERAPCATRRDEGRLWSKHLLESLRRPWQVETRGLKETALAK